MMDIDPAWAYAFEHLGALVPGWLCWDAIGECWRGRHDGRTFVVYSWHPWRIVLSDRTELDFAALAARHLGIGRTELLERMREACVEESART